MSKIKKVEEALKFFDCIILLSLVACYNVVVDNGA